MAPLDSAQPGDLSFLANPKYQNQLKTTQASAVILDLKMPVLDGRETLREMDRLWPDILVIISSGYYETNLKSERLQKIPFLQKPYTGQKLTDIVHKLLIKE